VGLARIDRASAGDVLMVLTADELARRLLLAHYPRSSRYDPAWVLEHMMGPHPLWLMERLLESFASAPGQRVMDLGCGKALTSVFVAREWGAHVHAVDLWISASENWARIQAAGEAERVVPIHAEAHALPFADAYFDAIVSVDAYHYFGTDAAYLPEVVRFLRPGGRLGIAVPGLAYEIGAVPDWLAPYWEEGFSTFHSPIWWRELWEASGLVEVERAELLAHGAEDWLLWSETSDAWKRVTGRAPYEREAAMLRADTGGLLGFVVAVARKRE
jgi:cyclopropane fatty-acyl-phospholipid synthase-like methyltransferase